MCLKNDLVNLLVTYKVMVIIAQRAPHTCRFCLETIFQALVNLHVTFKIMVIIAQRRKLLQVQICTAVRLILGDFV